MTQTHKMAPPGLVAKLWPVLSAVVVAVLMYAAWPNEDSRFSMTTAFFIITLFCSFIAQYTGVRAGASMVSNTATQYMVETLHDLAHLNKEAHASVTKLENNLVDELSRIGRDFEESGALHRSEQEDFGRAIRHAQAIILARTGLRSATLFDCNARE